MASEGKFYRVFVASPGRLVDERKAFRDVLNEFNDSDVVHKDSGIPADRLGGDAPWVRAATGADQRRPRRLRLFCTATVGSVGFAYRWKF